jgi:hypothetical protein
VSARVVYLGARRQERQSGFRVATDIRQAFAEHGFAITYEPSHPDVIFARAEARRREEEELGDGR